MGNVFIVGRHKVCPYRRVIVEYDDVLADFMSAHYDSTVFIAAFQCKRYNRSKTKQNNQIYEMSRRFFSG